MNKSREHEYFVSVQWTGNLGEGTSNYRAFSREHQISAPGKPVIAGSSDPSFLGDASRYNPEELLVASLAACHMLWYLHLCSEAKIIVVKYLDQPRGIMAETADGGGHFKKVELRPEVEIEAGGNASLAENLHERAHQLCFIANSMNFPVRCKPNIRIAGTSE